MSNKQVQILAAVRLISRIQGANADEIADKLGISRRTVYRLINNIEEASFPIFHDQNGKEVRYKLSSSTGYRYWQPLSLVNFNFEDQALLDFLFTEAAGKTVIAERIQRLRKKIEPLIAEGGCTIGGHFDIHGKTIEKPPVLLNSGNIDKKGSANTSEIITSLFQSMKEKSVIIVTYDALYSGKIKTYQVWPLALFEYSGGLYVYVFVPHRDSVIILAVERIKKIELTEEEFTPPVDFDARKKLSDPFGIILSEPFIAKVKFNAYQAKYIREREWPENTVIEELEDGGIIISIETAGSFELKRWLLSFGSSAELLEPAEIRSEIAAEYRKGNDLYK